jgi:hypothetical protein
VEGELTIAVRRRYGHRSTPDTTTAALDVPLSAREMWSSHRELEEAGLSGVNAAIARATAPGYRPLTPESRAAGDALASTGRGLAAAAAQSILGCRGATGTRRVRRTSAVPALADPP